MKILKLVLVMAILLSLGLVNGCHDGHMFANDDLTKSEQFVWEPTQTGFWHPKVPYVDSD